MDDPNDRMQKHIGRTRISYESSHSHRRRDRNSNANTGLMIKARGSVLQCRTECIRMLICLPFPWRTSRQALMDGFACFDNLRPINRDDAETRKSLRNYSVSVQRAKSLLPPLLFDCQTTHSTVWFQSGIRAANRNPLSDRDQCCTTRKNPQGWRIQ